MANSLQDTATGAIHFMYRFFTSSDHVENGFLRVDGPDVHHMTHVLRMRNGEDFEAVDETGLVHTCRIEQMEKTLIGARILFSEPAATELPSHIRLYMGLPKFEKMELIIQKAVELGVSEIIPVKTARTVVKLDEKKASTKRERWQTIALAAAKQSKRGRVPKIRELLAFDEALADASTLDHILLPYEKAEGIEESRLFIGKIRAGESIGIFIGPEGGFEAYEAEKAVKAGAESITLGKRILRCETAAITMLSILMFHITT